ncbi:aspartyl-phosphate phosphatase Spo0E family protein [Bacillus sp. FJAT-29790]|uniref:aspartyl-phosphate phosphatase Spo0E family protein n=1 Tax=Bacillus sp. FJAT-29790 TaxID=1895002 RepID=UPI001C23C165|nr:aspartyl-phosphate phosphatase Spo0E family protein [Bacillus sp. FJAT-29790]MBU8880186.1 aspartyl-phosphate phosphatase Spo0E family protein [Bacillus sp. FJAT-29790]
MCECNLLRNIEICRKEMIDLAAHTSLSNRQVVDMSTKLDGLLNTYINLTSKNKQELQ